MKNEQDNNDITGEIRQLLHKQWSEKSLSKKDSISLEKLIIQWENLNKREDLTFEIDKKVYVSFSRYDEEQYPDPIQWLKSFCHSKKTEIDRQADRIYNEYPTIMQILKA